MFQYLHNKSYYEDLYDLRTIEECLKWYWDLHDEMEQHRTEIKGKEAEIDFEKAFNICSFTANTIAIERYRHKRATLDEWMSKDRRIQEIFDSATAPHTDCDKCNSPMKVIDKTLHDADDNNPKVTFMYECEACKFRKILYSDGSAWDYIAPRCPKCSSKLKNKYSKKVKS